MATLGIAEFSQPFNEQNESYVGTAPFAESFNESDERYVNFEPFPEEFAQYQNAYANAQTFSSYAYGFGGSFSQVSREHNAGAGSQEISHPLNRGFYEETDEIFQTSTDEGSGVGAEYLAAAISQTDTAATVSAQQLAVSIGTGDGNAPVNDPNTPVNGEQDIVADSGTATEGQAFIALADTDSAFSTEAEVMQIEFYDFFEDEFAAATDEEALEAAFSQTDSAAGTETMAEVQTPDHFDTVINEEAQQLEVAHAQQEDLAYEEAELLSIVDSEAFNYVETQQVEVAKEDGPDVATTDFAELQQAYLAATEAAGAADVAQLPAAAISATDVGIQSSAQQVQAYVSSTDQANATETLILGRTVTDQAAAADVAELFVSITDTDSATSLEEEFIPVLGDSTGDGEPYYVQVLASNPRHYWRFAETSGTLLLDKQARADGLLYGPLSTARGLIAGSNSAFEFDGQQRAEFGDLLIDWSNCSIEFVASGLDGTILQKQGELLVEAVAGTTSFTIYNDTTPVTLSCDRISGHFALTVNNGVASLYCDGELHASAEEFVSGNNGSGALVAGLGATGTFDELAVYNRPLVAEEVFKHYYAAILNEDYASILQSFRPALHIPLDGSLDEYDGSFAPVETGTVAYVDGPEKYFVQPDLAADFAAGSASYDIETLLAELDAFSVGLAFRASADAGERVLASSAAAEGTGWLLKLDADVLKFSNGASVELLQSQSGLADGMWHSVVVAATGTEIALYLDGVLQDSSSYAADLAADSTLELAQSFDGQLAHIFVSEHALTGTQALLLSNVLTHGRADISEAPDVAGVMIDEGAVAYRLDGAISQLQG